MKRNLILVIAGIILALVGFSSCNREEKTLNFDEVVLNDYSWAKENLVNPVFYESQVMFENNIDEVKYPNVIQIVNVIQELDSVNPGCYMITHLLNTEKDIEFVEDIWMEDCVIYPDSINITLKDALNNLYESEYTIPSSSKMVFRNPLGPVFYKYPFYIFGQMNTGFIKVDAGTGEVSEINQERCDTVICKNIMNCCKDTVK